MKIVHIEGKEHVESTLRKGKWAIPRVLDWEYPDQWNWLTVRLSKHHPDRTPDLELVPEDRKKDAAGEKGQTPDFMLGKHRLKKRTMLASRSYEEFVTRQGLSPLPPKRLASVATGFCFQTPDNSLSKCRVFLTAGLRASQKTRGLSIAGMWFAVFP